MERTEKMLQRLGIEYETHTISAHRKPAQTREFAQNAGRKGIKVVIAGAGMAAHLAGVVAAETHLPVIGVPLAGSALNGLDALYSMVQMPSGVPVATMAIGGAGADNAAILAAQIIALEDGEVRRRLKAFKRGLSR
jgi:5-(carboxyamino)imidazole ribonucleotide mutase